MQEKQTDHVGDHHQSIGKVGKIPNHRQRSHRSAENDQSIQDLVAKNRLGGLDQKMQTLFAVVEPADQSGDGKGKNRKKGQYLL